MLEIELIGEHAAVITRVLGQAVADRLIVSMTQECFMESVDIHLFHDLGRACRKFEHRVERNERRADKCL